jgi:hypothetical protein
MRKQLCRNTEEEGWKSIVGWYYTSILWDRMMANAIDIRNSQNL